MKCRMLFVMEAGPTADDEICVVEEGRRFVPPGTVITHDEAWKLVHAGHAEPADEECRARVALLSPKTSGLLRQVHNRIMDNLEDFQEEQKAEAQAAEPDDDEDDEDDE